MDAGNTSGARSAVSFRSAEEHSGARFAVSVFAAEDGGKAFPPVGALRSPPPPSHAVELSNRFSVGARNGPSLPTTGRLQMTTTSSPAHGGSGGRAPGEGGRRRPKGSDEGEGFPPFTAVQKETAKRAPLCSVFCAFVDAAFTNADSFNSCFCVSVVDPQPTRTNAASTICKKLTASSDAPPTRAPSMSRSLMSSRALSAFTEPP
jgi:hypothetical protein